MQLEDVSYADRAVVVAAEMTVSGVEHDPTDPDGTIVSFSLSPIRDLDPKADYSVRAALVRAATAGDGVLQIHSDQGYPVWTRGFGDDLTIVLDQWTRDP